MIEPSPHYGLMQEFVEVLFRDTETIERIDAVIAAETYGLPDDLQIVVNLLPPGTYNREKLCLQMNSAIAGRGWGYVYGTVI